MNSGTQRAQKHVLSHERARYLQVQENVRKHFLVDTVWLLSKVNKQDSRMTPSGTTGASGGEGSQVRDGTYEWRQVFLEAEIYSTWSFDVPICWNQNHKKPALNGTSEVVVLYLQLRIWTPERCRSFMRSQRSGEAGIAGLPWTIACPVKPKSPVLYPSGLSCLWSPNKGWLCPEQTGSWVVSYPFFNLEHSCGLDPWPMLHAQPDTTLCTVHLPVRQDAKLLSCRHSVP